MYCLPAESMVAPAIEALSPDEDSEETLVVSKKKLEELVRRLERHLEELTKENERLRQMLELQEGRRSPLPSWVKPNTKKGPEGTPGKRGAKPGHEAHHRPPPEKVHETREAGLDACPDCGGELKGPSSGMTTRWSRSSRAMCA